MTAGNVIRLDDYRRDKRKSRALPPAPPYDGGAVTATDAIDFCLTYPDLITDWEEQFLRSIRRWRTLSIRQREVLAEICDRISQSACRP